MSIFSDIDAEYHRKVVARAINLAKEQILPLCQTAHAIDKVEAALQFVLDYCNENIQE